MSTGRTAGGVPTSRNAPHARRQGHGAVDGGTRRHPRGTHPRGVHPAGLAAAAVEAAVVLRAGRGAGAWPGGGVAPAGRAHLLLVAEVGGAGREGTPRGRQGRLLLLVGHLGVLGLGEKVRTEE